MTEIEMTEMTDTKMTETDRKEAEREPPALSHWKNVVDLVQAALRKIWMEEEYVLQAVVMIPKWVGDYHSIGLVKVMWKVVMVILNLRFTTSITFHRVLHGFRSGCGTGTTSLKAKLLQKLMAMR